MNVVDQSIKGLPLNEFQQQFLVLSTARSLLGRSEKERLKTKNRATWWEVGRCIIPSIILPLYRQDDIMLPISIPLVLLSLDKRNDANQMPFPLQVDPPIRCLKTSNGDGWCQWNEFFSSLRNFNDYELWPDLVALLGSPLGTFAGHLSLGFYVFPTYDVYWKNSQSNSIPRLLAPSSSFPVSDWLCGHS